MIANPNCSTILLVSALNPLHQKSKVKNVIVSTYQAVSGAGKEGIDLFYPELCYCGDNAAMIGVQAAYETTFADMSLNARATMGINEKF